MRAMVLAASLGMTGVSWGQLCSAYEPMQELGTLGLTAPVGAPTKFDPDGPGPSPTLLYFAANYTVANGVALHRLMTFDGQNFAQVDPAPLIGYSSMATYDVGSGPMLYVSGHQGLYRYSGTGWAPVPLPIAGAPTTQLMVFDPDGAGPLPVSLHMRLQTPQYQYVVYRYNAQGWTALSEPDFVAGQLLVFDADGPGPQNPEFYDVDSWSHCPSPCNSGAVVRRLSSAGHWEVIALMYSSPPAFVIGGAAVFDLDGPGPQLPKLVVTGTLDPLVFGGTQAAAWDGHQWSAVATPPYLRALTEFDPDGPGPQAPFMVASVGGNQYNPPGQGLMKFDGTSWEPFGGLTGSAQMITTYSPPGGGAPMLVVSGYFDVAGHQAAKNFAVYQGGIWRNVLPSPAGPINVLEVFNDGTGQKLFAGGEFSHIGDQVANNIARWNGSGWQTAGMGVHSTSGPARVSAMAVHNDGSGWALYVGGRFDKAGALSAGNVARWTGQQWQAVPGYQQGMVRSFRSFDDGTGRALYMAGDNIVAGGHAPNRVARLNASGWSALPQLGDATTKVNTLAIHIHGGVYRIHALGLGIAAVLHPGQWVALPPPPVEVFAARSFQQGQEHALIIGGYQLTQRGWRWVLPPNGPVHALSPVFDDGHGPSIFVGGSFTRVSLGPSPGVARLRPCVEDCYANCDQSSWIPTLTVADFTCFLQKFAAGDPYANCDQSVTPPVLNVADFSCFLAKFAAGCP
jgi:hypothetical protein